MKTLFTAGLIIGVLSGGASALAATDYYLKLGDIKGESSARATTSASVTTGGGVGEAQGSVEASLEVKGGAGLEQGDPERPVVTGTVENDTLTGIYIKIGDVEGESAVAVQTNFSADTEIRVLGVEVRGWDPEKKKEVVGSASVRARTTTELAVLAAATAAEDTNIEEVSFNFQKITWEYKSHGNLFGFIPLTFTEEVTVATDADASERVKVRFPWYRFLLSDTPDRIDIATSIEATLEAESDLASIEARARAFTAISNVLKTKHDTAKNSIGNIR